MPPKGNEAYLSGHAVGVQIYSCNGTDISTSGQTVEVPYTADYVFFKARRASHGRLD